MTTDKYLQGVVKRFDLKNKTRQQNYVWNRQYFCYYVKSLGLSQQRIGALLGRYNYKGQADHTLAGHCIKKCKELLELKDAEFINSIQEISKDLSGCPNTSNVHVVTPNSPFLNIINRIFEARDMEDIESLKAYINENIEPKDFDKLNH
jgi:hypothetical protein